MSGITILFFHTGIKMRIHWTVLVGAVVKNPPANAGNMGSSPGQGRSHMPWAASPMHLNYWARALAPTSTNYRAQNPEAMLHKRSHHTTTKSRPHSTQLKLAYSNKYSEQPKINNFLKLLFKKNESTSSLIEIKNEKYIDEHGSSIFLIEISYHNLTFNNKFC